MSEPTKGYVIVASRKKFFYVSAINLMESIKDYYPEAQITFVVEERFLDGQERIADNVIFCDNHARAKLIGMAKSPYDITFYVDADIECEHEDIATIFDKLDGHDLMFTGYLLIDITAMLKCSSKVQENLTALKQDSNCVVVFVYMICANL